MDFDISYLPKKIYFCRQSLINTVIILKIHTYLSLYYEKKNTCFPIDFNLAFSYYGSDDVSASMARKESCLLR